MILVTRSSMPDFNEYCDEIKALWDTHMLTNSGTKYQEFEKKLRRFLKVPEISLFVNGHCALENVIKAMDLKGEVITTPFTFASTTQAIVQNGLTPVFCDIDPDTYTIDASKIEELITDKTCAIVPVHVYGNVCDVERIDEIAKRHNLKVIYDAAHVFSVEYKGNGIGVYGDASMFSFHATKVFNTIEGGCVTTCNSSIISKLNSLKNFGLVNGECMYVSGNSKMNEFQAAMGLCNLRHIDIELAKRKKVFDRYCEILAGKKGIKTPVVQKYVKHNYAYFPVLFNGCNKTRDEVFDLLKSHDIIARKYFYPLTSSFSCYKDCSFRGNTPIAEYISKNVLCLPMYSDLALDDVDKICSIILK